MPKEDPDAKWSLTKEANDKLLARFSPDREEAGRQLLLMQARLVRFFERRSCPCAEDLVDKTVIVVTRKIDQGEIISNLTAYFLSVADIVFKEWLRLPRNRSVSLDEVSDLPDNRPPQDEQKEARLRCLDECLGKLSKEKRDLILGYYSAVKRAKINARRELASESSMNALRIRVCRIRKDLEKCVKDCLKGNNRSEEMNMAPDSL